MANLNISVNRETLKSIQNHTHELASLEQHVNALKTEASGEAVDMSEETRNKFKKSMAIFGQARRGGLQAQLGALKKIYDHACERSSGAPGAKPAGTIICNDHPDSKHLPEWPAEGPTQEQRDAAWDARWPLEEHLARLSRNIEQSEKRIGQLREILLGEKKRFGEDVLKVALMAHAVAPELP